MTNLIQIVFLVTTNAINVSGDFKREAGTNFVKQASVSLTNVWIEEYYWCTNRTLLRQDYGPTNTIRWTPVATPPGTPGRL
jgi:hypothetical protein